jgi:hypothetical protein
MRRISFNRYDATLYLDEFEDHCLTLKNAPHAILTCVAYETLVNEEDQACSTLDTPHTLITIRRISIKISPDQDPRLNIHAPHTKIKIRRIYRRCTNIPEYINLGPHAKLSQCAASATYAPHRSLRQKTINTPRPYEFKRPFTKP